LTAIWNLGENYHVARFEITKSWATQRSENQVTAFMPKDTDAEIQMCLGF
jgi:hypothetical protein